MDLVLDVVAFLRRRFDVSTQPAASSVRGTSSSRSRGVRTLASDSALRSRRAPRVFVFARPGGATYTGSLVADRLRTACKRAGITRRVTFHGFRRFFATEALAGTGGDVAGTADALGHARGSALSVTVDLYARAREGAAAGAVAAVDKALKGGPGGA